MTILYQSECGSAPILWLSIVLWSFGAIMFVASIILWFHDEDPAYLVGIDMNSCCATPPADAIVFNP